VSPGAPAFKTADAAAHHDQGVRFDTKIAVVVRDDLAVWQKLNVVAFLSSAVAGGVPETIGLPYEDGSGSGYLPMFRQPVLVYAGDAGALTRAYRRVMSRGLCAAVYTEELFGTDNDVDNRAAVRAVSADRLKLVGLAAYGPRGSVDRALDGLRLHP
jgi:hypothetical protein